MADKEVNFFIVDVGQSMGEQYNGRTKSDLDYCLPVVWDKIGQIVATGRKTNLVAFMGLGTNGTRNHLAAASDGEYDHITTLFDPQQVLKPQLDRIRGLLQSDHSEEGDAISAIVIATAIITTFCRQLKYKKRIVLFTNARAPMEGDDDHEIRKQLLKYGIELHVIGIDFNDMQVGFKEEDKDTRKHNNEMMLSEIATHSGGSCRNISALVSKLGIPFVKTVRPFRSYRGTLTIGWTDKLEEATISINVEQFACVMPAKPLTEKQFAGRKDEGADGTGQSSITMQESGDVQESEGLAAVKRTRAYQVDDPSAPGGKRDVEKDDLEKGFEYGRTAVHVNADDMSLVQLETSPGLEVVGFVAQEKFERYLEMGKSSFLGAAAGEEKHALALSSFIHGLVETEQYAVCRHVTKDRKPPLMVLLAPYTAEAFEALVVVELPFAEDVRNFKFPPLDRIITVSGKALSEHRTLPNDKLMDAMGRFVESMDLANFNKDDNGRSMEYGRMQDTYNPYINRINQVVQHRLLHPEEPLPEPYQFLTRYMHPPEGLVERSTSNLKALIVAAEVKKVPPKQKGKRRREAEKPLSGLDVDALLRGEKRKRIDPDNAIPEFRQALGQATEIATIRDLSQQMGEIIENTIRNSPGALHYARAANYLGTLREELAELEEPEIYNDFLRQLKPKIIQGQLGGERTEVWFRIRTQELGLIDNEAVEASDVTLEQAKKFYIGS